MSINFGGSDKSDKGSGTTQLVVPEASPQETELRSLNLELAKRQIASLDKADQEASMQAASPLAAKQKQLQDLATQNLLDRLTGKAPVLSPEQQAQLDQIYGSVESQGQESLNRFADELSGMRGLNKSDTPVAGEALRNARMFQQNLAGQKAASALDLGSAGANFNATLAQFQNNLQQQAFANRLAIAGLTPASYGLQNSLFSNRAAQGTTNRMFDTTSTGNTASGGGTQSQFGNLFQGLGGIFSGGGATGIGGGAAGGLGSDYYSAAAGYYM